MFLIGWPRICTLLIRWPLTYVFLFLYCQLCKVLGAVSRSGSTMDQFCLSFPVSLGFARLNKILTRLQLLVLFCLICFPIIGANHVSVMTFRRSLTLLFGFGLYCFRPNNTKPELITEDWIQREKKKGGIWPSNSLSIFVCDIARQILHLEFSYSKH